ncbi:MAG: hypothetical protein L6R36_007578 [Xanthoria steineri]|nr:MAG: hypothetical protein L6R36_007578 [Xanthoria steineri]
MEIPLMIRTLLLLFTSALLTNATPDLAPRQAQLSFNGSTLTSSSALSSAAEQLIVAAIPPSILPAFAIAIQSAAASASITGNINSLVTSVLTAATPAPFLENIPTPYQSRLDALESQVSRVREEASEATVKPTLTRNATVVLIVTTMGSTITTSYAAEIISGTVTSVISGLNETMAATTSTASETAEASSSAGGAAGSAPPPEEGLAMAKRVPLVAAVMWVLGLVGAAAVL